MTAKGVNLARNLRKANAMQTLEALGLSVEAKEALIKSSCLWKSQKRTLQDIPIEWDKQGKHIRGHNNFRTKSDNGIFTHSDPQSLLIEFAGKGRRSRGKTPGECGYQEIVYFK